MERIGNDACIDATLGTLSKQIEKSLYCRSHIDNVEIQYIEEMNKPKLRRLTAGYNIPLYSNDDKETSSSAAACLSTHITYALHCGPRAAHEAVIPRRHPNDWPVAATWRPSFVLRTWTNARHLRMTITKKSEPFDPSGERRQENASCYLQQAIDRSPVVPTRRVESSALKTLRSYAAAHYSRRILQLIGN